MKKLSVYNFASLDGYFEGAQGDLSFGHHGPDAGAYAVEMLSSDNALLFGRITYEMMASYWPTSVALDNDATMAAGMNGANKFVFSRTLSNATWQNTRILSGDLEHEVRSLKSSSSRDLTILGSGSIARQLAALGLIDEYEIMVNPILLGAGKSIFAGLERRLSLRLVATRTFSHGNVLLRYAQS
jgi:dihydrofolate reductase